jgi:hypothetical protein
MPPDPTSIPLLHMTLNRLLQLRRKTQTALARARREGDWDRVRTLSRRLGILLRATNAYNKQMEQHRRGTR